MSDIKFLYIGTFANNADYFKRFFKVAKTYYIPNQVHFGLESFVKNPSNFGSDQKIKNLFTMY